MWKILSAANPPLADEQSVKIGDLVYLANQYSNETYLDVCGGASCDPTSVNNVTTSRSKDRANQNTAVWEVVAAGARNSGDPLRDVDPIYLQSQHGTKAFLDVCGSAKGDTSSLFDVSTSSHNDRSGLGTAKWTLRPSVSVDWEDKVDDVEFDGNAQDLVLSSASGNPKLLFTQRITNDSDAQVQQTIQRTEQKTATFEFTMTQTLAGTASVKCTVGVPGVASGEASLSVTLTLSAGEKWTDTTQETFTFGHTITVPPQKKLKALGQLDWVEDAMIPARFLIWVSAKDRKTLAPLTVAEIKRELAYSGFDGSIIDDKKEDKLLVSLKGEFRGSWGVDSTLSLVPG